MPTIHDNINFRKKIVSLLLDPYWCVRYASLLSHEYFETDIERRTVKALLQYYTAYKKPAVDPIDIIALAGDDAEDYVLDIFDTDFYDKKLASDIVVTFVKEQKLKIAILESVEDIEHGKLHTVLNRISAVLNIDISALSPGIDLIEDSTVWLQNLWINKVTTGWPSIDHYLDGGVGGGELLYIMSPSNRGKTMALINMGYNAASIGSAKKIAHWTGEIDTNITAKRYAARMLHRFVQRGTNTKQYQRELLEKAKKLLPGKIRIFGGHRTTLYDLENQLDAMRNDDYDFGMVIIDYPDLLKPLRTYSEKRFELTDIAEGLRDLAKKYNVPFCGASQSNRASYTKETIDLSDIAEDIGKVNTADIIITLSQTKEEFDTNRCRLHLAKVRDGGRVNNAIYAKYYPKSQAIVAIGE